MIGLDDTAIDLAEMLTREVRRYLLAVYDAGIHQEKGAVPDAHICRQRAREVE